MQSIEAIIYIYIYLLFIYFTFFSIMQYHSPKKTIKASLQFLPTFHGIVMFDRGCYTCYKFQKHNQILINL